MVTPDAPVIEVFADVSCPFTHVGLIRLVAARRQAGRDEIHLRIRAWPLEIINGAPTAAEDEAKQVAAIRRQVAPDLFAGFRPETWPSTTLPALALAGAAYEVDDATGEAVSLALRHALFEQGRDVADEAVLADIAGRHGVPVPHPTGSQADGAESTVAARFPGPWGDLAEGRRRGVIGSPHFFPPGGGDFFCPALDISRVDGQLVVNADPSAFDAFTRSCFAA